MTALGMILALTVSAHPLLEPGRAPLSEAGEARVLRLGKALRCPVCQGLSIADSPSSMARAQLDRIRQLVLEGKSDEQIRDYFVERYGEWALLEPKAEGFNWLVWGSPVLLLGVGAWVVARQVRAMSPAPTTSASGGGGDADDPYLRAVREKAQE